MENNDLFKNGLSNHLKKVVKIEMTKDNTLDMSISDFCSTSLANLLKYKFICCFRIGNEHLIEQINNLPSFVDLLIYPINETKAAIIVTHFAPAEFIASNEEQVYLNLLRRKISESENIFLVYKKPKENDFVQYGLQIPGFIGIDLLVKATKEIVELHRDILHNLATLTGNKTDESN